VIMLLCVLPSLTVRSKDPQDNVFLPSMDFDSIKSDPSIGAVVCGFDMVRPPSGYVTGAHIA
jgi:hypothetical protein